MNQQKIIDALKEKLETNPAVHALWLEGSISNGSEDEYSDIDIVADVEKGKEDVIFQEIEDTLREMGDLDLCHEFSEPTDKVRYKVLHIEGTSEHFLIDVNIQTHGRDFSFIKDGVDEQPLVLFDKSGVVTFNSVDIDKRKQKTEERLKELDVAFYQRSKVRKYIARGKYLEAFAYYEKHILHPLVELLRLKHKPLEPGFWLVNISKHLPSTTLSQVEDIFRVTTLEEMEIKLQKAEKLYMETMTEFKS